MSWACWIGYHQEEVRIEGNWIGVVAPAGTPPEIVERLHREISAMQDSTEVQKQFANEGADVVKMTSGGFGSFMKDELAKWGRVVNVLNIGAKAPGANSTPTSVSRPFNGSEVGVAVGVMAAVWLHPLIKKTIKNNAIKVLFIFLKWNLY